MLQRLLVGTGLLFLPIIAQATPVMVASGTSVYAVRTDPGDGLCANIIEVQNPSGEVFMSTADAISKLDSPVGQNLVGDRTTAVYTEMRFHNKESTAVGDFPQAPASMLPYDTYYALRLRGYINITSQNLLYTDAGYSLAGARLRIGPNTLFDFNSNSAVRETRQVNFAGPGLYPIEVVHYANGGIAVLELSETASAQPEGPQTSLDTTKFALIPGTQLYTASAGSITSCQECGADADCGSGNYCIHDWVGSDSTKDGLCSPCNTAAHCGNTCMKCGSSTPYCLNQNCVECVQDNQCAAGSRCISNHCMEAPSCPAAPACGTNLSCDPVDGCVNPCASCPAFTGCDSDRQICLPLCATTADCPMGSTCETDKGLCFRVERYVGGPGCSAGPSGQRLGSAATRTALLCFALMLVLSGIALRRRRRRSSGAERAEQLFGIGAAIFFCTTLAPLTARADLSANAATFRPAIGIDNIIVVDGTTTPGQFKPMFSALLEYENKPLRLIAGNGVTLANTVPNLVSLHLMGGLGLTRWLAVGIDVPVVLYQGFDPRTPVSDVPSAPSSFGIGDVRLTVKARIINNDGGGFGLAFAPLVTFPSGKGSDLRGSDGFNIEPRFALDYRFDGGHLIAANLGFMARTNSQNVPDQLVGHTVTYGIGGLIALPLDFGLLLDLTGGVSVQSTDGGSLYVPTEMHGGVRWVHRRSGFNAMIGGGGGFTNAVGSPEFRLFASLGYLPIGKPAPAAEHVWVEIRKTGDGTGNVNSDTQGIACGEVCSVQFPRGATITLVAEPSPTSDFVEWNGPCSGNGPCTVKLKDATSVGAHFALKPDHAVVEVRKHGDGTGRVVSDPPGLDCGANCGAGYPGGGLVRLTAHPDGDSTFVGWSGPCSGKQICEIMITPGQPPAVVEAEFTRLVDPCSLRIADVIHFKTGDFTIEPDSHALLDDVVRVLQENPGLTLRIEGNTDSQPFVDRCDKHDLNPWLSRMRADEVRRYLREHGVDEMRLSTIGYGPTNPKTDNSTEESRHQNRRTEFQRTDPAAAQCPNFAPKAAPPAIGRNLSCGRGRR